MRAFFAVLLLSLTLNMTGCATPSTRSPSLVQNPQLQVDAGAATAVPTGWRIDGGPDAVAVDASMARQSRPSLRVGYKPGPPYAGIVQRVAAAEVRGKRLVVDAWLARNNNQMPTGVWIRAFDKDKKSIAYANTYEAPLVGSGQLSQQRLMFSVPEEADVLLVGASVYGDVEGAAWFNSLDVYVDAS
jgi:hypothetical protein